MPATLSSVSRRSTRRVWLRPQVFAERRRKAADICRKSFAHRTAQPPVPPPPPKFHIISFFSLSTDLALRRGQVPLVRALRRGPRPSCIHLANDLETPRGAVPLCSSMRSARPSTGSPRFSSGYSSCATLRGGVGQWLSSRAIECRSARPDRRAPCGRLFRCHSNRR